MKEFVKTESLINWLQMLLDEFMEETKDESESAVKDRVVHDHLTAMLGCKEMVEALIEEPVNLRKSGKVEIGF